MFDITYELNFVFYKANGKKQEIFKRGTRDEIVKEKAYQITCARDQATLLESSDLNQLSPCIAYSFTFTEVSRLIVEKKEVSFR